MDKLRKQLNKYLLEYRFESKKNHSPFFDVKINSCKIILKTKDKITLYIDRISIQNYINKLYETLNQKASNIQRDYNLDVFKDNELRDIAQSKDFESYENLLFSYDEKVNEKENEKQKLKIEGNKKISKGGFSLVKKGANFYLENQSKSIEITSKMIGELKNKKEGENKETKDPGFFDFMKDLNLESEIDNIFEGIDALNLKDKIEKDIELIERQKAQIEKKKDYLNEFICILKLYNLLKKKNLDERNDYEGIFLTGNKEKKQLNDLFSEYDIEVFI